jgi:hypothetical protein
MVVTVVMDVEVIYSKIDEEPGSRLKSGWDTTERFQALGMEAADRAIRMAESTWALSEEPDPDIAWDKSKVPDAD